jgi:glutathione S-transferase
MWSEALGAKRRPFLFGAFGAVDAFYAPVASRIRTTRCRSARSRRRTSIASTPCRRCRPGAQAARREGDFLEEDEPYRQRA